MYISNGIVYAGDPEPLLKVKVVEPVENYKLRLTFSTGERKIYDITSLLDTKLYAPLKDITVF